MIGNLVSTSVNNSQSKRLCGLLVIDMQNGYCNPKGSLRASGINTKPQESIIPNVVKLVQACRAFGCLITWCKMEYLPGTSSKRPAGNPTMSVVPALRGSWDAELVDELKALVEPQDENVIKYRMSAFFQTPLELHLRAKSISEVILCGVSTGACVDSTARDAFFRDFRVSVVSDCVASSTPELDVATLRIIETHFGSVVSSDELIRALGQ